MTLAIGTGLTLSAAIASMDGTGDGDGDGAAVVGTLEDVNDAAGDAAGVGSSAPDGATEAQAPRRKAHARPRWKRKRPEFTA